MSKVQSSSKLRENIMRRAVALVGLFGIIIGTEIVGRRCLRIKVDKQDMLTLTGIYGCQVNCGGSFAYTAFVVADCERTHEYQLLYIGRGPVVLWKWARFIFGFPSLFRLWRSALLTDGILCRFVLHH